MRLGLDAQGQECGGCRLGPLAADAHPVLLRRDQYGVERDGARAQAGEIARVVAPGGRFVIVESSQPEGRVVRGGFHLFLRAWVGPLGGLIAGERAPYRYLASSARQFYTVTEVEQLLLDAGFSSVRTTPMLLGAAALHVALK